MATDQRNLGVNTRAVRSRGNQVSAVNRGRHMQ